MLISEASAASNSWLDAYGTMRVMAIPEGFSSDRWRRVLEATRAFMGSWAAGAARLGWSDLDVFGCHPMRPDVRLDCMGLVLLLDGCEIVGIDERGADLSTRGGVRQRFRRRQMPPPTVPLLSLAKVR
jgi:hypothetical protein